MATNVNVVISQKKFSHQSLFYHKLGYSFNEIESADADETFRLLRALNIEIHY